MASLANYEAAKYAWSRMPKAAALIGDATPEELRLWCDSADILAAQNGVEAQYTELAGELLALGEAPALARIVALWAAKHFFGVGVALTLELAGLTDDDIETQRLKLEADREEAETRRFYREDFPEIAAARGQRVEDSPAWQRFVGGTYRLGCVDVPLLTAEKAAAAGIDTSRPGCDWSADRIRDEYRRWWTTAERRHWDAEYAAAKPHAADDLEAARFATRRVLDRRIEAGARRPAAASAEGASA